MILTSSEENIAIKQISLVNMRVKICPIDDRYQQILTYASVIDRPCDRTTEEFFFLYPDGDWKSLNELNDRLPSEMYGSRKIEGSQSRIYWPQHQNTPSFPEECYRWSFCHIASRVRQVIEANEIKVSDRRHLEQYKGPEFAMHICIANRPGTIHGMLSALNPIASGVPFDQNLEFDFNIDHIRSTACRVQRCVKVDFYGRFRHFSFFERLIKRLKSYVIRPPQTKEVSGLDNVQSIVFYYPSPQVRSDIDKIFRYRNLNKHLDKISHSSKSYEVYLPAKRSGEFYLRNLKRRDAQACPVARKAGCPALDPEWPNPKFKRARKESILKIEVCLGNRPGALMDLIWLIGTSHQNKGVTSAFDVCV